MQADAAAAVHALAGAVQAAPGALCAGAPAAMRGFVAARKAPGWRCSCVMYMYILCLQVLQTTEERTKGMKVADMIYHINCLRSCTSSAKPS